ncbi:MAG TPA: hypothetical protein DEA08_29785 [Planctomycetes bacterium]|mgnify:CR=1 FL=1|nr:hypothetical protein [Planctomycetota bacterium]
MHLGSNSGLRVQLALFATALLLGASHSAHAKEDLVPADLGAQTDANGFRWDLTRQGYVNNGTSYTFNRAMVLSVNNAQFNPSESLMAPDKSVYVFRGKAGGTYQVERRVSLDLKTGRARFVDLIKNPERKPKTVIVKLYTRLARSCDHLISDKGRDATNARLEDGEVGLFAYYSRRSPSVAFQLASDRAAVRPAVQALSRRTFHFTYVLKLPPRGARAVVTTLCQLKLPKQPDAKLGKQTFDPLTSSAYVADVPKEAGRVLVNFEAVSEGGAEAESLLAGVEVFAEQRELDRSKHDTVLVDERESMQGELKGSTISVESPFGRQQLPLEELVFWRGGGGVGYPMLLALRNGELLSGKASCADLRLATQTGIEIPLSPEGFQALVRRKQGDEPTPSADAKALLKTHDGSLLLLGETSGEFKGLTPWGSLSVPLSEVVTLRYGAKGYPGLTVTLADGTRLPVVPAGQILELDSLRCGRIQVELHRVNQLQRLGAKQPVLRKGDSVKTGHASVVGGGVLVGELELADLKLISKAGESTFKREQIHHLRQLESEGGEPSFEVVLHTKERFEGRLAHDRLPFRTPRGLRQVPSADLRDLWQPEPPPPAEGGEQESEKDENKEGDF